MIVSPACSHCTCVPRRAVAFTAGCFNEDYCTWCYHDGAFVYPTKESLIDYLVEHFSSPQFPQEQARSYYEQMLGQLKHWQDK